MQKNKEIVVLLESYTDWVPDVIFRQVYTECQAYVML